MTVVERKGERTRRRILEAARAVFAQHGYERTTIRTIAAEAECDKSSVIQYFGTKQQLFREAVEWEVDFVALETDDADRQAENYLRQMLADFEDSPMSALLRASMTNEDAAQLLREKVTSGVIDNLAATLTGSETRLRSALMGAMMFGIAVQRDVLRMPDLAEADLEDLLRIASAPSAVAEPELTGAANCGWSGRR